MRSGESPPELARVFAMLGLTDQEERVYEHLLHHGGETATDLGVKVGIAHGMIYAVLRGLQGYGVVTNDHRRPMRFWSEPVTVALARLHDRKVRELEEATAAIRSLSSSLESPGVDLRAFSRDLSDGLLAELFRDAAGAQRTSSIQLAPSTLRWLEASERRLGTNLRELVRSAWRNSGVRGTLQSLPEGAVSYVLVDGTTTHLILLDRDPPQVVTLLAPAPVVGLPPVYQAAGGGEVAP